MGVLDDLLVPQFGDLNRKADGGEAQQAAARLAYNEDQPRDDHGRWSDAPSTFDGGDQEHLPGVDPDEYEGSAVWAERALMRADNFTGEPLQSAYEVYVKGPNGEEPGSDEAIEAWQEAGFRPGSAMALSDSIGQWTKAFETSSDIYEAAQALQGGVDPETHGLDDSDFAYAREILNAMANGAPTDDDEEGAAYSPYSLGSEYDGPTPALSFDATDGDGLVRGVGDREGILDSMREAFAAGEPLEWPMASFVWGSEFDDYRATLESMSGEPPGEWTPDQSALNYAEKDGYDPILISLQGTTEGALAIDGQYEVLTGGKFRIVDIREEEVPTGIVINDVTLVPDDGIDDYEFYETDENGDPVEDENGDPVELDTPRYIGPTTTVTRVIVEQIEGPKAVSG